MKDQTVRQTLFSPPGLRHIQDILQQGDCQSRSTLAREVCRRWDLCDARGKPQAAQCVKVLRDMEAKGLIVLPPPVKAGMGGWGMRRQGRPVPLPEGVPGSVDGIGHLSLVEVAGEESMRTWNEMMMEEHPLGKRRMMGRQVRYLIRSEHGWLGGFGFGASALKLEARDRWLGWDENGRRKHLDRVVGMNRFLIRPGVKCENLASRCLGLVIRRLGDDFERRYGFRPWLLESFVDTSQYAGTCYRAANWEHLGQTKGRGRNDRRNRRGETVKDIYVYPLEKDFRERMGLKGERESGPQAMAAGAGMGDGEWGRQEFGGVELGDKRLTERLVKIATEQARSPREAYLEACGGERGAVKGYYKLVGSHRETVNMKNLLSGHKEQTLKRMAGCKTVCVIQDTTDLNFGTLKKTTGLGVIGRNQTKTATAGLKLHTSLAVDGGKGKIPLGVLGATCWAQELRRERGKCRNSLGIEEKESFRWLEHYRMLDEMARKLRGVQLVSVMDREGDIWELLQEARKKGNRVPVVVRAQHDRCLADGGEKLYQRLAGSSTCHEVEVKVPRQRSKEARKGKPGRPGMKARRAMLTVTFERVLLKAPATALKKNLSPLEVWAVYAWEKHPPEGAEKIEWMLLTTLPVLGKAMAAKVLRFYRCRWRIEEWHEVLKSGCRTERHSHETAQRLKVVVALDMVIAWRILLLTLLARKAPDTPASEFFTEWECKALELMVKKTGAGLTLGEALLALSCRGGYLNRRGDPPPGIRVVWRGWRGLIEMAYILELFSEQGKAPRE